MVVSSDLDCHFGCSGEQLGMGSWKILKSREAQAAELGSSFLQSFISYFAFRKEATVRRLYRPDLNLNLTCVGTEIDNDDYPHFSIPARPSLLTLAPRGSSPSRAFSCRLLILLPGQINKLLV